MGLLGTAVLLEDMKTQHDTNQQNSSIHKNSSKTDNVWR